jgi:hypothetical protein
MRHFGARAKPALGHTYNAGFNDAPDGKNIRMTDEQKESPSGLRYQMDRQVQRIGPLRTADRWALRHPVGNALCFVFLGAFFAVLLSIQFHSWIEGVLAGTAIALLAVASSRNTHRRRVRNGTSAEYDPPR